MACSNKLKILPLLMRIHHKYLQNAAFFCTKPAYEPQQQITHFRTTENNPTLHTAAHIGKFYVIPAAVKERLFFSGGVPKALDIQMKTFREAGVLIRQPAIEIMSYLHKLDYSKPAVRFVVYGYNGVGKSSTLTHVLHYGHVANFLLLHVPWVSHWTKRLKKVAEVSQYNEKRVDLSLDSALWLQHFKLHNADLMAKLDLRTTKSYTWSLREVTEEGSSLMDVVEQGIQRVRHASDCVAVLLKEIKHHSQYGKFRTMVLVDGVNAFFYKTNISRPGGRVKVPPHEVTIVRAFVKVLQNDWNNAVIVTSVDTMPKNRYSTRADPYTPYFLLGQEGFEVLDPFIPIHVDYYTDKEFHSVLDYYHDRLWLLSEKALSDEGRKQLKFLSGNHPGELMALCDPL